MQGVIIGSASGQSPPHIWIKSHSGCSFMRSVPSARRPGIARLCSSKTTTDVLQLEGYP